MSKLSNLNYEVSSLINQEIAEDTKCNFLIYHPECNQNVQWYNLEEALRLFDPSKDVVASKEDVLIIKIDGEIVYDRDDS